MMLIVYNLEDNVFHTTLGMWYGVYIYNMKYVTNIIQF